MSGTTAAPVGGAAGASGARPAPVSGATAGDGLLPDAARKPLPATPSDDQPRPRRLSMRSAETAVRPTPRVSGALRMQNAKAKERQAAQVAKVEEGPEPAADGVAPEPPSYSEVEEGSTSSLPTMTSSLLHHHLRPIQRNLCRTRRSQPWRALQMAGSPPAQDSAAWGAPMGQCQARQDLANGARRPARRGARGRRD